MIERVKPHTTPSGDSADPAFCTDPFLAKLTNLEKSALAEWVFNSHWWVEHPAGYFTCKWCGREHGYTAPITPNMPLCPENPALKQQVKELRVPAYNNKECRFEYGEK